MLRYLRLAPLLGAGVALSVSRSPESGRSKAQEAASQPASEHRSTCDDLAPGASRPEHGCFNIARITGLRFRDSVVYWHLSTYPSRAAAEASRSGAGVVVEEAGKVQPGQRSIVHTHPGPERWYMLAGEQCLETSVGVFRGGTGQTVVAPANIPMELTITGNQLRRSLLVVIHDARESRGKRSEWQPTGACSA